MDHGPQPGRGRSSDRDRNRRERLAKTSARSRSGGGHTDHDTPVVGVVRIHRRQGRNRARHTERTGVGGVPGGRSAVRGARERNATTGRVGNGVRGTESNPAVAGHGTLGLATGEGHGGPGGGGAGAAVPDGGAACVDRAAARGQAGRHVENHELHGLLLR